MMTVWARLRAFARSLRNGAAWERAMDEELQAYLEADMAARTQAGMSPGEARR